MLNTAGRAAIVVGGFLTAIGLFLAGQDWTGGMTLLITLFNLYQLVR